MSNKKTEVKMEDLKVEVKSAEEREAAFLAEREAEILKKYKRVIPGSIRREPSAEDGGGAHAGKLTVEIRCATEGCPNTRRVATSDLFQVKYCEECTKQRRLASRRKKAKKARAAKKAEALPVAKDDKKGKKGSKKGRKPLRPLTTEVEAPVGGGSVAVDETAAAAAE